MAESSKRKRRQSAAPRGARAAKRRRQSKTAPAPRGQIGPQTYDAVRKIVDEKGIPVGKAFAEVAKATGRQPGTVAVTYYRIARLKGGPPRERASAKAARRKPGRPRGSGGADKGKGIQAVLARVSNAIRELEGVIAHQAAEIERLRSESGLADRIRKALRE